MALKLNKTADTNLEADLDLEQKKEEMSLFNTIKDQLIPITVLEENPLKKTEITRTIEIPTLHELIKEETLKEGGYTYIADEKTFI